jgi:hypothetical protein
MPVRGKVTKAVQCRGGAMRYHPLRRCPVPGEDLRGELEPGCPKPQVIRRRRPRQPVHAMSHPIEDPGRGQPLQGSRGDASLLGLTAGH